jgi:hypothetical protein
MRFTARFYDQPVRTNMAGDATGNKKVRCEDVVQNAKKTSVQDGKSFMYFSSWTS